MARTDRKIDMLHGSIWDKLLLFALPLAATGMLQQLFNAADVAVIGQFVGKTAMAAVGSNSPVTGLLVNGFVGISLGANVIIARLTGQEEFGEVSRAVHTALLFPVLCGFLLMGLGQAIAPWLLGLLSVPENVFPMALLYLRIYLLGLPVNFLYNFAAAIFRSQGDTRTPLLCLTISGVANVLMNLFFVCVIGMTVDGVAAATALSQLLSAGMLVTALYRRRDAIRLEPKKLRIHRRLLAPIIRIGLPAGIQSMVFSLSNLCIQSAINQLGSDVMAASAAAFNIEILAYFLINSFGQACTTFVGQNCGAQDLARCRRVTRISLLLDVVITVAFSLGVLACGPMLLSLFGSDPAILSFGMTRLRVILYSEALNVVMEILSGSMRGYGRSMIPAMITLVGVCGLRVTWVYTVFAAKPTLLVLMAAYPVSWAVTAAALTGVYFVLRQTNRLN